MPLPRKFAYLLEIERGDVEAPDYLWLVYSVCALSAEGCGWGGWAIEVAFKADGQTHPTGTGDRVLSAADEQICPRCGRGTFRTGADLRLVPSAEQARPLVAGVDYKVLPIEYDAPPA